VLILNWPEKKKAQWDSTIKNRKRLNTLPIIENLVPKLETQAAVINQNMQLIENHVAKLQFEVDNLTNYIYNIDWLKLQEVYHTDPRSLQIMYEEFFNFELVTFAKKRKRGRRQPFWNGQVEGGRSIAWLRSKPGQLRIWAGM